MRGPLILAVGFFIATSARAAEYRQESATGGTSMRVSPADLRLAPAVRAPVRERPRLREPSAGREPPRCCVNFEPCLRAEYEAMMRERALAWSTLSTGGAKTQHASVLPRQVIQSGRAFGIFLVLSAIGIACWRWRRARE